MRIIVITFLVFNAVIFNGCLIFHKISYKITTDGKKGTAEVYFYDIRSNAENPSEFDEDKTSLFTYMWKSAEFLSNMKNEGKEILERELFLSGDTLNGKAIFSFDDISSVENIMIDNDFYYMTLPLEDSVISTNGEIITSQQYKRILWERGIPELRFEILGFSFEYERYRPLGYHFKSLK